MSNRRGWGFTLLLGRRCLEYGQSRWTWMRTDYFVIGWTVTR